jgi:hypothetical protein
MRNQLPTTAQPPQAVPQAAAAPADPPTDLVDLTNHSAAMAGGGQPLGAVQLAGVKRRVPPSMGAILGGAKRKPMFG